MENLNAFLNPIKVENKKIVVSDRFIDNDKSVEWEIKTITATEEEAIRKSCTKKGTKAKSKEEFDPDLFNTKIMTACVVYPDLKNAELQNAYDVMNAEDLLKEMLTMGEYMNLLRFVQEINGFHKTIEELLDEAKN